MAPLPTGPDQVTPGDFSRQAIQRAVTRKVLQSPLVLYPSAIGVVSGLAALLLDASPIFLGGLACGVGVGLGGLAFQYLFKRDAIAHSYIRRMQDLIGNKRQHLLAELSRKMHEQGPRGGVEQVEKLQVKFNALVDILGQKMDPGELTFGRYIGIAEQVFLSGIDNLDRAAGALTSIRSIDPDDLTRRIQALELAGKRAPAQHQELITLRQRLELYDKQKQKIAMLMAQNEEAMTRLDLTAAAIADMKPIRGHASMDMESAMNELQALIKRASSYSA